MKHIRKFEAFKLRDAGFEKYVKHNYSKKRNYYVVENKKVLEYLERYLESIMVK